MRTKWLQDRCVKLSRILQSRNALKPARRTWRKRAFNDLVSVLRLHEFSEGGRSWGAAASVGADLAIAPDALGSCGGVILDDRNDRSRKVTGERMNRRGNGRRITRVYRAVRWARQDRCRAGIAANHLRDGFFTHRAVVGAVTAAAGRQPRVIAGSEAGR